jgi:hypothetical protein
VNQNGMRPLVGSYGKWGAGGVVLGLVGYFLYWYIIITACYDNKGNANHDNGYMYRACSMAVYTNYTPTDTPFPVDNIILGLSFYHTLVCLYHMHQCYHITWD